MTCRQVTEFLMDYLSAELPPTQQAAFEKHLEVCPECVAYLKSYKRTVALGKAVFRDLDEQAGAEVPEQLVQAILAARRK
jgi:anti-sigma factor RsiW